MRDERICAMWDDEDLGVVDLESERADAEAEAAWEAQCELAYARYRERISERGTWFGRDSDEDRW